MTHSNLVATRYPQTLAVSLVSALAAMVITAAGLRVAASATDWAAPAGGAIVGAGVACMHYIGMWALEVPGHMTWSTGLIVVSIGLGMLFGMAAMAVAVRHDGPGATIAAATLLTLAIVSITSRPWALSRSFPIRAAA